MALFRKSAPNKARELASQLDSGRFLNATELSDDRYLIFTSGGFHIVTSAGEMQVNRPWTDVSAGRWSDDEQELTVTWVDQAPPVVLDLQNAPKEIPITFRECVNYSVVAVRTRRIGEGKMVRAAVRRRETGEMFTQTTASGPGADLREVPDIVTDLEREVLEFIGR